MNRPGEKGSKTSSFFGEEPRTYKQRLLTALPPCILLCTIYLLFGPLELVYINAQTLWTLNLRMATPYYLIAFLVATAAGTCAVAGLRASLFDDALKFIVALSLASYLQCNLWNPDFGLLNERSIHWSKLAGDAIVNLGYWFIVFAVVWVAAAALKKHWPKVMKYACLLLTLMQLAGLASLYVMDYSARAGGYGPPAADSYRLEKTNQYTISKNQNIIVFVLDACSNSAIKEMMQKYPDALDGFADFTYFDNCAPVFYGTFPSIMSTLTGNDAYDPNASYIEYERQAWESQKAQAFYTLLKEKGFYRQILGSERFTAYDISLIEGKIDNASPFKSTVHLVNLPAMFKQLGALTFFRYFPLGLKPCFDSSIEEFRQIGRIAENDPDGFWNCSGVDFYRGLSEKGIRTTSDNMFSFYHFDGSHAPFDMDENCLAKPGQSNWADQTRGYFRLIETFLLQMKEQEAYQNATIVIMADHGDYSFTQTAGANGAVLLVKLAGEHYETMPVNHSPVTLMELLPTLAQQVDPDTDIDFGKTLWDIPDKPRQRTLYRWFNEVDALNDAFDSLYVFHYESNINDPNDLSNPDEVLRLKDCFY